MLRPLASSLLLLVALLVTSIAAPARAQALALGVSAESELKPIEELSIEDLLNLPVVTASGGKAQTQALAAANVVSVSREEIVRHGWRSVGEVLEDTVGMYVVEDGVQPSLSVRGVSGGLRGGTRIVKVMINGVAVNYRPDLTAFLGPEYIPMDAVARVEVAKGPLSALYGANAFLAVVNVITRDAHETRAVEASVRGHSNHGKLGVGASGFASVGTADRGVLLAVTADRVDRSGLSLQQTFPEQSENPVRYGAFFAGESTRDLANPIGLFGQAYTKAGPLGKLTAQGGLQSLDSGAEFQLSSVLTHQSRIALLNGWGQVQLEKQWSDQVSSLISAAYSMGGPTREERLWLTSNTASSFRRNFGYRAFDAVAKVSAAFPLVTVDAGADFSYEPQQTLYFTEIFNQAQGSYLPGDEVERIGESDLRKVVLSNFGAFVQASATPFPNTPDLELTGNARVDFPNLYANQFSWRTAAAYRFNKAVSAKLVLGQAFQAPSAVLLYGVGGFGNANNVIGNRVAANVAPLRPQRAQSVEAMVSSNVLDKVALEGAVFMQRISDKIEFVQYGANFRAANQGEQFYAGAELKARASLGRFSPFAQGTYEVPVQVDPTAPFDPDLALFPTFWMRGGLDVDVPEALLVASAQARWVGPRGASQSNELLNNGREYSLPSYLSVDVSIGTRDLKLLSDELETKISLSVRNLLDERHSEPGFGGFDVPSMGRTAMLELRQQL